MKIFVPKETAEFEARVAAHPANIKKLIALGASVTVEQNAGINAGISNEEFTKAGASIGAFAGHDVILCVNPPAFDCGSSTVIGIMAGSTAGSQSFDMQKVPRITRAQSMDVLSSQANLAGYRAVIDAMNEFGKAIPMMMTAAGTITPAKVCVVGAGVAGLQAIATAKRMGAVVSAFDVRSAAKEQVQSLGAKFIEVEGADAEDKSGYAKEVTEEYKQRQAEALKNNLSKTDIVITTAQIPGKPAPKIITEDMISAMQSGSVIVDLAVSSGGNTALSKSGENVVTANGVKILGHPNLPSKLATDASKLYAQNLINFLSLIIKDGKIVVDENDEIIKATLTRSLQLT